MCWTPAGVQRSVEACGVLLAFSWLKEGRLQEDVQQYSSITLDVAVEQEGECTAVLLHHTTRCRWWTENTYDYALASHETLLLINWIHVRQYTGITRNVAIDQLDTHTTIHSHHTKRCCWTTGYTYNNTLASHKTLLLANRRHVRQYTDITRGTVHEVRHLHAETESVVGEDLVEVAHDDAALHHHRAALLVHLSPVQRLCYLVCHPWHTTDALVNTTLFCKQPSHLHFLLIPVRKPVQLRSCSSDLLTYFTIAGWCISLMTTGIVHWLRDRLTVLYWFASPRTPFCIDSLRLWAWFLRM